jgi:hypothetical protein
VVDFGVALGAPLLDHRESFTRTLEMTDEKKPTLGAQRRFENLPGMHAATIALGGPGDPVVKGTVIDISPGAMCVRLQLGAQDAEALRSVAEGDPVEAEVAQSPSRRWTVLGHAAWIWVPSMVGDDTVGSLGVDVAGVVEEDHSWLGRLRGALVREDAVEVDRARKGLESPAARRKRESLDVELSRESIEELAAEIAKGEDKA